MSDVSDLIKEFENEFLQNSEERLKRLGLGDDVIEAVAAELKVTPAPGLKLIQLLYRQMELNVAMAQFMTAEVTKEERNDKLQDVLTKLTLSLNMMTDLTNAFGEVAGERAAEIAFREKGAQK